MDSGSLKQTIKRELDAAKAFDSYFHIKEINQAISDIRPYSPRSAKERAATKLANHIDAIVMKSDTPNGGVSVVRFLYALVELRWKREIKMMDSERGYYYPMLDDFIKTVLTLAQYPYVLFTQNSKTWKRRTI